MQKLEYAYEVCVKAIRFKAEKKKREKEKEKEKEIDIQWNGLISGSIT